MKIIDKKIVKASIYPGIGIARVGDSKDDFFIGPEVVDSKNTISYRDVTGALKRQAARFRIYGYNAAGEVVREITAEKDNIVWNVHVANRKAQWYQFQYALDIPEAINAEDNEFQLRNQTIEKEKREQLAIDPGIKSISGISKSGVEYYLDNGTFQALADEPINVYLGELRTDEKGRLLFLGGRGISASPTNAPIYDSKTPSSFNNANDWYDDICDGPVDAKVTVDGIAIPVDSAWVVTAPPNFAPDIISWRTMYDLLCDVYVKQGWMDQPEKPSFSKDILPLLQRLTSLQWVNKGFSAFFGKGSPMDFNNPSLLEKLSYLPEDYNPKNDLYAELRRAIFHNFRPAEPIVNEPIKWPHIWPWIYGDAFGSFDQSGKNGSSQMLAMTSLQEYLLQQWVSGQFINDWTKESINLLEIEDLPLTEQPEMLNKAALHYCLADTFHPGCEMTWPMRHASLYRAPFRIRTRVEPESYYGTCINPIKVKKVNGPLYGQIPGGLTRWMGLPWQGDTAFCRSGYDPEFDPYVPTFWAARVPNQVLSEDDYATVMDLTLPKSERLAAFQHRESWVRGIDNMSIGENGNVDVATTMLNMIKHFKDLGIIEQRKGITDDPDFPEVIYVETMRAGKLKLAAEKSTTVLKNLIGGHTNIQKAGWINENHYLTFRNIRLPKS